MSDVRSWQGCRGVNRLVPTGSQSPACRQRAYAGAEFAGGPGQAGLVRWAAVDDRRAGALLQCEAGNLVLARKPDIRLASCVFEKAVEHPDPTGVAGDAIVKADHHHPSPSRALLIELIELVLERLLIGVRVPPFEREGDDVVQVERIGHGHEVATVPYTFHLNDIVAFPFEG